jgi:hypothetical protein
VQKESGHGKDRCQHALIVTPVEAGE